ncbi:hypothetical protein BEWA_019660 [Theileria equi strain WA]|uniref:Uncharacterized protein n=1 Tax=Theileria equi strain WA TaxID=1537102 RepID=L0AU87_THEEQ|nr:hypothetical protein BEWA_019660 [Theileria equi strain WA]AFZ79120.1 hypothetical protein BEWA_019660 [Theileria equi strain WA]|eukprot:XP_004828786.1 hypothetical protein BEWA_019660 [Theileria equi strain WA]
MAYTSYKSLGFLDESVGFLILVFLLYSTTRLIIKLPLSIVYSIAIQITLSIVAFCLINFHKFIIHINHLIHPRYGANRGHNHIAFKKGLQPSNGSKQYLIDTDLLKSNPNGKIVS